MLSSKIKQLRDTLNLSQQKLADMLGVTQQAVAKWERNKAEPDTEMLKKLANIFNVSIDYLLCETDSKDLENSYSQKPESLKLQNTTNINNKLEIYNLIVESLIEEGLLDKDFKLNEETEIIISERIKKIVQMYDIMFKDKKNNS